MDPNELEVVYTTTEPTRAELIRGMLQSEGIASEVEGENQAGLSGVLGVRILTRAWDADRARKLIKSHEHHHGH